MDGDRLVIHEISLLHGDVVKVYMHNVTTLVSCCTDIKGVQKSVVRLDGGVRINCS